MREETDRERERVVEVREEVSSGTCNSQEESVHVTLNRIYHARKGKDLFKFNFMAMCLLQSGSDYQN